MVLESLCEASVPKWDCSAPLTGVFSVFHPFVLPTVLFSLALSYKLFSSQFKNAIGLKTSSGYSGYLLTALGGLNILKVAYLAFLILKSFLGGAKITNTDLFTSLLVIAIDVVQAIVGFRYLPNDVDLTTTSVLAFGILVVQFFLSKYFSTGFKFTISDTFYQTVYRAITAALSSAVAFGYQRFDMLISGHTASA